MSGNSMGGARIAIIGAGLMGHGLAQVFALAGHQVAVTDPSAASLASLHTRIEANLVGLEEPAEAIAAALARVHPVAVLEDAVADADYVLEAAVENLAIKQDIFRQVEAAAPRQAVLASNTSVIPITQIMAVLEDGSRAVGTHWWNPPFLVPLVEVIETPRTAAAVVEWTLGLHRAIGKVAVHVRRDVPGFIGNRLQHALWREAMAVVAAGIADAETVDKVVKAGFGRRLGVLGPLENADLVGLDLSLAIHETVLPDVDCTPGPVPLLRALVAQGKLGMKTGEGFRSWTAEEQAALRSAMTAQLRATRNDGGSISPIPWPAYRPAQS